MPHHAISSPDAPAAIGPYNPAVVHEEGRLVFASGQVPLDPATGEMISGEIGAQTVRVLESLRAVLEAAGSGMDRVLKTTVYMTDLAEFAEMNEVYAGFFPGIQPARATVEVSRLPKGARVEIDAVAAL